jgi:short-subunit dehydrogenase
LTRTEFHSSSASASTVQGIPPWLWADPRDVARLGFAAVIAGRTVVVPGMANRLLLLALRIAPRTLVVRAGRLVTGLRRGRPSHGRTGRTSDTTRV